MGNCRTSAQNLRDLRIGLTHLIHMVCFSRVSAKTSAHLTLSERLSYEKGQNTISNSVKLGDEIKPLAQVLPRPYA